MIKMMIPPSLILVTLSLVGETFGFLGLTQLSKGLPLVASKLLSMDKSNILISMKDSPTAQLSGIKGDGNSSRAEKATKVTSVLQTFSALSQAPVLSTLGTMGVKADSFWISNQIFVKDANPVLIKALMSTPSIASILEERSFPLLPLVEDALGKEPNGTEWNVEIMEAPKVWDDGTTGEGILVGGVDSGVRHTHAALKDNFVGKFGWFDPYTYARTPSDLIGHGTHTMGTTVGRKGIGIAPGAKWMACKACLVTSCQQHTLLACGQFMLCPSSPKSGKNEKDCEGVPDVVINSWGGGGGEDWYDPVIEAWVTAGIKPFFAQGNSGPKCETGGSPADNDLVIAVGSTDKDDKISKFSSRGPKVKKENNTEAGLIGSKTKKVTTDIIKPNICAPGEKVNSAYMTLDNSYKVMSGTSMATPAACGVAALLLSKNPKISLKKLKKLLYTTTDQKLNLVPEVDKAEQCGPIAADTYPNHMCGHGRINAWKAYQKLKEDKWDDDDEDDNAGEAKKKPKKKGKKPKKEEGKKKKKASDDK